MPLGQGLGVTLRSTGACPYSPLLLRYMCDVARLAISLLKAEAEPAHHPKTWRLTVSGKALSSVCQERLDRDSVLGEGHPTEIVMYRCEEC